VRIGGGEEAFDEIGAAREAQRGQTCVCILLGEIGIGGKRSGSLRGGLALCKRGLVSATQGFCAYLLAGLRAELVE
jgi:hypothetical protein